MTFYIFITQVACLSVSSYVVRNTDEADQQRPSLAQQYNTLSTQSAFYNSSYSCSYRTLKSSIQPSNLRQHVARFPVKQLCPIQRRYKQFHHLVGRHRKEVWLCQATLHPNVYRCSSSSEGKSQDGR